MNINSWLEKIKLGGYSKLFSNKGITLEELSDISTTDQLKELGIRSSIVRDRLLSEITKLNLNKKGSSPLSPSGKALKGKKQITPSSYKQDKDKAIPRIYPLPKKELNEYEEAIIENKKELRSKIKELGSEHEEISDCYYELGTNYYMNSQYEKAIVNHKKSLAIRIKCYGEDDVDVVIAYYQLGQDYYMNCNYEKAISHHKKALVLQKELNEDDDHNEGVAAICFDLAKDYYYDSQYDNSLKFHNEALDIRQYLHGEEDSNVADIYYQMGLVYQAKYNSEKALFYYSSAYNIYTEVSGEYSDNAVKTKNLIDELSNDKSKELEDSSDERVTNIESLIDLGDKSTKKGSHLEAKIYYHNALEIIETIDYNDNTNDELGNIYFKLGTACKNLNEHTEAEVYFKKAINYYVVSHGEDYFDSARSFSQLGDVYYYMDDYENAIKYHDKALSSYSSINEESLTAWSHYDLGLDYYWIEDYKQSIDHFLHALDIRLKLHGPKHDSVAKCYNRLGLSYYWDNDYEHSILYHKKALELRKQLFGSESEHYDNSAFSLAKAYYYANDEDHAKKYFLESLSYKEQHFGKNSKEYNKVKEWLDKTKS